MKTLEYDRTVPPGEMGKRFDSFFEYRDANGNNGALDLKDVSRWVSEGEECRVAIHLSCGAIVRLCGEEFKRFRSAFEKVEEE